MNKYEAVALLGEYAFNTRTGSELTARIERLITFSQENPNEKIVVEVNNNWSRPPNYHAARFSRLLGGKTYAYQVWAIIR